MITTPYYRACRNKAHDFENEFSGRHCKRCGLWVKGNMRIIIESKPYREMRYRTLGDYFYDEEGTLFVYVAETGNDFYNKLIAIHELAEEATSKQNGIREPEIAAFDRDHQESEDPSDLPDSPCHSEHSVATAIERILLALTKCRWRHYEDTLTEIQEQNPEGW